MTAWYNEVDPYKAAVLREAIKVGAIAPGDVDERSIVDVRGGELTGYTQCHFFAGGGFWSYALRQAGWPDDRPVDTGSCPCPSFSEAGKGLGFDDDRHLWPEWYSIIRKRRPPVLFGEQSHAAIGFGWLDLVCGNLEAEGYAVAPSVLGAHSVGAPHRRQRLYFCADTDEPRSQERRAEGISADRHGSDARHRSGPPELRATGHGPNPDGWQPGNGGLQRSGELGLFAQDCGAGGTSDSQCDGGRSKFTGRKSDRRAAEGRHCEAGNGGDPHLPGAARFGPDGGEIEAEGRLRSGSEHPGFALRPWRGLGWLDPVKTQSAAITGATRGFWADCDWWGGTDEKYRPIKPGIFPLAQRYPGRVGLLRLAGDAICIPLAVAFIRSYIEARACLETQEGR